MSGCQKYDAAADIDAPRMTYAQSLALLRSGPLGGGWICNQCNQPTKISSLYNLSMCHGAAIRPDAATENRYQRWVGGLNPYADRRIDGAASLPVEVAPEVTIEVSQERIAAVQQAVAVLEMRGYAGHATQIKLLLVEMLRARLRQGGA